MMTTININIPENVDLNEMEMKIILAGELYERSKLSIGQAAELAGLSKRAFIEIMGRFGFSIFNHTQEDLLADINNA
jgi:predicted HTH domain antitoxin